MIFIQNNPVVKFMCQERLKKWDTSVSARCW